MPPMTFHDCEDEVVAVSEDDEDEPDPIADDMPGPSSEHKRATITKVFKEMAPLEVFNRGNPHGGSW